MGKTGGSAFQAGSGMLYGYASEAVRATLRGQAPPLARASARAPRAAPYPAVFARPSGLLRLSVNNAACHHTEAPSSRHAAAAPAAQNRRCGGMVKRSTRQGCESCHERFCCCYRR